MNVLLKFSVTNRTSIQFISTMTLYLRWTKPIVKTLFNIYSFVFPFERESSILFFNCCSVASILQLSIKTFCCRDVEETFSRWKYLNFKTKGVIPFYRNCSDDNGSCNFVRRKLKEELTFMTVLKRPFFCFFFLFFTISTGIPWNG